jgi:hypothetical protein
VEKPLALSDFLEAAAYAVVGERCRQAHLHDLRGELQTLHSSLELLMRAAKTPGTHAPLAEKAGALAKKTLLDHEKSLVELLNVLTPHGESATPVDVGGLMGDIVRFLRNDASRKSIVLRLDAPPGISILAHPHKSKVALLGLCSMTLDELPAGASLTISVGQCDSLAFVEWKSDRPLTAADTPLESWDPPRALSPYELLLVFAWRWTSANGGRMDLPSTERGRETMRLYYPFPSAR